MKTCTKCKIEKEISNFFKSSRNKSGCSSWCKGCAIKSGIPYRKANKNKIAQVEAARYIKDRERILLVGKKHTIALKQQIIKEYGGKCVCCGEVTYEFLTIDHINNDGAALKKNKTHGLGKAFYQWLKKNNFPKDNYQLHCMNCNFAKGLYGECPHQKVRKA
jgi:hypothetical protein